MSEILKPESAEEDLARQVYSQALEVAKSDYDAANKKLASMRKRVHGLRMTIEGLSYVLDRPIEEKYWTYGANGQISRPRFM